MKDKGKVKLKKTITVKSLISFVRGLKIIDDDEPLVGSLEIHTSQGAVGKVKLHKDI